MQYPGTIDNWIDQSAITEQHTVDDPVRPIFLTACALPKGPEDIKMVYGDTFYKLYGTTIDSDKYGQIALQASAIINAGGKLLIKRVVSDDATLANAAVVATVKQSQVQKTNAKGEPLYIDKKTQTETTEATGEDTLANEKVMINVALIKYEIVTVTGKKNKDEIITEVLKTKDPETDVYPLFVIYDTGRGESTKRFSITPDYTVSKNLPFMMYSLNYLGAKNVDYEYTRFALKPATTYINNSMALSMTTASLLQARGTELDSSIEKFYEKVSTISGIDIDTIKSCDILFAKDTKGKAISGIAIDETSVDLSASIGFPLQSGSNGAFGDTPIEATESYEAALNAFYTGEFDDDIFNLDRYKPDVCVDGDYPESVKKNIVKLADFRKDFFFFGDLGLDVSTYDNALNKVQQMPKSKFAAWYGQTYDIIEPFNKKYKKVTIAHGISSLLVDHLRNRRNAPYCGILYNWIISDMIEGTLNYAPKITPEVNQKTEMDDNRLNYASILNNALTLETTYTSQEASTQLSFINNVISIQEVVKDVRDNCPAFRYSLATSNDLDKYKTNVENILKKYKDNFKTLNFVYAQDEVMAANKIFEADIEFTHKDFYQSEILNLYTLSSSTTE